MGYINHLCENTVSKHKWGYELQIFPVAVLHDSRPSSYLHYGRSHTCQPRTRFPWILPNMKFFPNHWSMQISLTVCDKALWLWATQITYIWSKKRIWILQFFKYEKNIFSFKAEMFFLQSRKIIVSSYTGVKYKNI